MYLKFLARKESWINILCLLFFLANIPTALCYGTPGEPGA